MMCHMSRKIFRKSLSKEITVLRSELSVMMLLYAISINTYNYYEIILCCDKNKVKIEYENLMISAVLLLVSDD